jgi:hypothetical protein
MENAMTFEHWTADLSELAETRGHPDRPFVTPESVEQWRGPYERGLTIAQALDEYEAQQAEAKGHE